jgi:hypothetical protein
VKLRVILGVIFPPHSLSLRSCRLMWLQLSHLCEWLPNLYLKSYPITLTPNQLPTGPSHPDILMPLPTHEMPNQIIFHANSVPGKVRKMLWNVSGQIQI